MEDTRKKNNKLKYILLISYIALILFFVIPSLIILFKNNGVANFSRTFRIFKIGKITTKSNALNSLIFAVITILMFVIYFLIIKKSKDFTRNNIKILLISTSILFILILPQTSTDVYGYISTGWLNSNYNKNPYYTTVQEEESELKNQNKTDNMFSNMFVNWKADTTFYGPIWTLIVCILTKISFGNITLALFEFKLLALIVHLICCYLIYKITNNKKMFMIYAFNPLILFESLANVHNDIYIILFILLAVYYLIKKKNLMISVMFISIATCIKYFPIFLLPLVILYYYKEKNIKERIKYCLFYGMEFIALVSIFYLIYIKDFTVLKGLFVQQDRYNRSLMYIVNIFFDSDITSKIKIALLLIFGLYYLITIIKLFFKKEISMELIMKKYNYFVLIFLFVLITNFNSWYVLWLIPQIIYIPDKMKLLTLSISTGSMFAYTIQYIEQDTNASQILFFIVMIAYTIVTYIFIKDQISFEKEEELI